MQDINHDAIRQAVRERYSRVATSVRAGCGDSTACCDGDKHVHPQEDQASVASGCGGTTSCCSEAPPATAEDIALVLGYTQEEVTAVPQGANMGLGCGNPRAIAALKAGETVLDLGSGGGFDCFLAARHVGPSGHVIGVDMTPEMLSKARKNADETGCTNVEFRLGEIEHLPVADSSVDVIISNCVINLSPSKEQVFQEAFRVLKSGGRLAIADIVTTAPLPEEVRSDFALYTGCMAGAALVEDLQQMLTRTGFVQICIRPKDESKAVIRDWAPGRRLEDYVVSATIEAMKT